MAEPEQHIAPGALVRPRRFVPRFHWELIACGLRGHSLLGTDARSVREQDAVVVRDVAGVRWHRCLRCDAWVPLPLPAAPTREHPPERDEVLLPLRGRPLRDKVILRLIAVNRFLHFVVLGLVGLAILLFSANRDDLHDRVVAAAAALTGTTTTHVASTGLTHDVERLFSLNSDRLHLFAAVALLYAAVEGIEAIGLWRARRWAEYLTLTVTASLLPLEIFELTEHITPFKVVAFVINVAVVIYLLYAKRLFGLRGGVRAEHALRERDLGWPAVDASAPPRGVHVG